jgi:hypothetical protein
MVFSLGAHYNRKACPVQLIVHRGDNAKRTDRSTAVPTQLLKTRREVLLKFVEGLIEGIHVFKTNRELALSVLRQEGIKSRSTDMKG